MRETVEDKRKSHKPDKNMGVDVYNLFQETKAIEAMYLPRGRFQLATWVGLKISGGSNPTPQ